MASSFAKPKKKIFKLSQSSDEKKLLPKNSKVVKQVFKQAAPPRPNNRDSGISASSGSQDSIELNDSKRKPTRSEERDLPSKRWDGPTSPTEEASQTSGDDAAGDSEASTTCRKENRKKCFRKSRKKSVSPTHAGSHDDSSTDEDDEVKNRAASSNKNRNRSSPLTPASSSTRVGEDNLPAQGILRRLRPLSRLGRPYLLSRTLSSPGLGVAEYFASNYLTQDNRGGLPSCLSTPIRLASRQNSDSSLNVARPKFLALGDGSVSVEPRVRTSLTRGTPIRSQSVCFGSIIEATAEGLLAESFAEATEKLLGKLSERFIGGESVQKQKKRNSNKVDAGSISPVKTNKKMAKSQLSPIRAKPNLDESELVFAKKKEAKTNKKSKVTSQSDETGLARKENGLLNIPTKKVKKKKDEGDTLPKSKNDKKETKKDNNDFNDDLFLFETKKKEPKKVDAKNKSKKEEESERDIFDGMSKFAQKNDPKTVKQNDFVIRRANEDETILDKNETENLQDKNPTLVSQSDLPPNCDSIPQNGEILPQNFGEKIKKQTEKKSKKVNGKSPETSRSISPAKDKLKMDSMGDELDLMNGASKKKVKKEKKNKNKKEKTKSVGGGDYDLDFDSYSKRTESQGIEVTKEQQESLPNIEPDSVADNQVDADLLKMMENYQGDSDVFISDLLPGYAKSYILPRVMNREQVDARRKKDEEGQDEVFKTETTEDRNLEAFKFSMLKASLDYDSGFTGTAHVPPKPKLKKRIKKLSTGSSDRSDETSGRGSSQSFNNSNPITLKKSRKTSSSGGGSNCTGPGNIGQYVNYVKSGGFVPLPILEPERGVEASLFAQYPGLDALDEDGVFSLNARNRKDPNTLDQVHITIDQQFNQIREKFGEPTIVIRTAEEEEMERQKLLQRLLQQSKVNKKKQRDDLLDTSIPPPSFESGYSTWLEASSVDTMSEDAGSKNLMNFDQKEHLLSGENTLLNFANPRDLKTTKLLKDAMTGNNLLGMMEEPKEKFNQPRDMHGANALDLFIDPIAIFGSDRHPALQAVLQQLDLCKRYRAEKLRLQEELFRLRSSRKDNEARREHLLNKAKVLQARAAKFKAKLADVWEQKLQEEQEKTGPLEQVCAALREDLDTQHKKRMEALEIKMKPIIIKDGPSKKANYKIMAARLHYEIYALTQRLRLTTIRAEHEQARREKREREVRRLRQLISEKKTTITTVTKGIPFNKLEVRPQDQQPSYSGPIDSANPLLSGMPNATLMASGRFNSISPMFGTGMSSIFSLPNLPGLPQSNQQPLTNPFANQSFHKSSLGQSSFLPPTATGGSSSSHSSSIPSSAAAVAAAAGGLASKTDGLPNGRPPQAIQTT